MGQEWSGVVSAGVEREYMNDTSMIKVDFTPHNSKVI